MIQERPKTLEALIRICQLDWMIDSSLHKRDVLPELRKVLEKAEKEARKRGHNLAISEAALVGAFGKSPQPVKAFLEALASTRNPQMLAMAWRIIQGVDVVIESVQLDYSFMEKFNLRVTLTGDKKPYETSEISDFALVRHFGYYTAEDAPVLSGFYALRLTDRKLSPAQT